MKEVFSKIASVLMAFLVLFSTMSFTIDMHYCGDLLVDASIFSEAESCGMDMHPNTSDLDTVSKRDCCSGTIISIDGDDEFTTTFIELSFEQQIFVASFVYTYINLFEGPEEKATSFLDYYPPLVVKDIQLLDEQFLI